MWSALGLIVGVTVLSIFRDIVTHFIDDFKYRVKSRQPLSAKHRSILNKYSAYYKLLSTADRALFERRVQRFMFAKRFISRGVGPITDEMRVLISASAIQLTFGLTEIYLSNFDKILVYPNSYYSHITKKYHLGEVNPRAGIIILSWKSFVDGYADPTDSLNVGIHEMAHAIHFENRILNEEYDFLDIELMELLKQITAREIWNIRNLDGHFLRDYAATNAYEFFAVSLEYFFEQPVQFKQEIPDLYELLVRLLNQDPIRIYKLAS
ncbi:DgsA anti-repressor MtfA [Fulvivirga sp. RKSG066]|nr:DgsA anti-repressor MtfA [Fulvivirga aurantia]